MRGVPDLSGVFRDAAGKWGGEVALTDDQRSVTFDELWTESRAWASRLRGAGLQTGGRVLVVTGSRIDDVTAIVGTIAAGGTAVVIDTMSGSRHLSQVIAAADATVAVCEPHDVSVLRECGWSGTTIDDRVRHWVGGVDHEDAWSSPSVPSFLIYTSGSTGGPKGVVCRQSSVLFALDAIQARLVYKPTDTVVACLPLTFDYGLYQVLLGVLAGSRVLLMSPSLSSQLMSTVVREHATIVPMVPGLAQRVVLLARARDARAKGVRLITNTGEALEPSHAAALREVFPDARLVLMYGLTECKRVTIADPDEDLVRPGSAGPALPGTTLRVIDSDGRTLAPYEIGELEVLGPHVMDGYWRDPVRTQQRFRLDADPTARSLRTGDYGYLDEDGRFYHRGRRDGVFKVRGIRVSAYEIEEACARLDGVVSAVVIPPSDTDDATLLVGGSITKTDLVRLLCEQIGAAIVPPNCIVVPELPVAPTGKVDRAAVRRMFEAEPDGT